METGALWAKATGAMVTAHSGDVDYITSASPELHPRLRSRRRAKNLANAKLGVRLDDVSKLSLIF